MTLWFKNCSFFPQPFGCFIPFCLGEILMVKPVSFLSLFWVVMYDEHRITIPVADSTSLSFALYHLTSRFHSFLEISFTKICFSYETLFAGPLLKSHCIYIFDSVNQIAHNSIMFCISLSWESNSGIC